MRRMSREREGSIHARALFMRKPLDVEEWTRYDENYQNAVKIVATNKKRPELVELDHFIHSELPVLIQNRTPPHMLHEELAKVMKWKLTRGKFRPLQKMAESNSSAAVVDASTKSFKHLSEGDWESALDAISKLRAIGVATASAILCLIAPNECPFMADEVLEGATSEGREYNNRAYAKLRLALREKAKELGEDSWTAERVGRAMWACAILNSNNTPQPPVEPTKPSKAKRGFIVDSSVQESEEGEDNHSRKKRKT